jgi:hypothetical protein
LNSLNVLCVIPPSCNLFSLKQSSLPADSMWLVDMTPQYAFDSNMCSLVTNP